LDAVGALLVAVAAIAALARRSAPGDPGQPWWASPSDGLLFGPDAGEWALNAVAFAGGNLQDLDGHRMPGWTVLTAAVMHLGGLDVVHAGHLVCRVEHVVCAVAIYALGRVLGMGGGALLAGLLVATDPKLVSAAERFGVDPTVTCLVPLTLLAARAGGRWWGLAPLAGAVAGFTTVSHLTALGFAVPGLLACVFAARGWRALPAGLLYAAGAAGVVWTVYQFFPWLGLAKLQFAVAEGVAPTAAANPMATAPLTQALSWQILRDNAPTALEDLVRTVAQGARTTMVPWALLIALPWLGLVGAAPFRADPDAPSWGRRLARALGGGIPVALCLAPLLAFSAARAPERYSDNLLPIGVLLVVRGAEAVVVVLARLVRLGPAPILVGELALAGAWLATPPPAPPTPATTALIRPEDARARELGRALAAHFPTGIGAVSPIREALPYAGMRFCPSANCPFTEHEQAFLECVQIIQTQCRGEGDIPYVVTPGVSAEQVSRPRAAMDVWIEAHLDPIAEVGSDRVYRIPRTGRVDGVGGGG